MSSEQRTTTEQLEKTKTPPPPNPHDAKCLVLRELQRRRRVPPEGEEEKPPEEEEQPYPGPYPSPARRVRRRMKVAELAKQCAELNGEPCPYESSTEEVMMEVWDFSEAIASAVEKAIKPHLEKRLGELDKTAKFLEAEAKRIVDGHIEEVEKEIQRVQPDFKAAEYLKSLGLNLDGLSNIKLLESYREQTKVLMAPKVEKPVLEGKKLEEFNATHDKIAIEMLGPEMFERVYGKPKETK